MSPDEERAVVANHRSWFRRSAEAAGRATGTVGGVPWAVDGVESRELTVLLDGPDRAEPIVDEVLETAAGHRARAVRFWAAREGDANEHGPTLLGRGFSIDWRPRWMWLTPEAIVERPLTGGPVAIVPDVDGPFPPDLDYGADLPVDVARRLTSAHGPQVGFRFAVQDGQVIGQAAVQVTASPLPVGVIYNAAVVPAQRRRGIGAALTIAAARHGFGLGAELVALNATAMGAPLYAAVGFTDRGEGHTWLRPVDRPPSTAAQRALTEALARDDAAAIDAFDGDASLDDVLPCGQTPFRLAGDVDAALAAEALHRRGARVDAVAAWRLGWHDRLPGLLAAHPEIRDAPTGPMGATPLHEAVQFHDVELARVLLAAGADVTILDRQFRMTAAGWAGYFGHRELVDLITMAGGPPGPPGPA